jgi:RNA polymerase sigma factor (sigma-70 family)
MRRHAMTVVLDHVRRLADPAEPADGELLRQFVTSRDEPAFEALVRRHGPLAYGLCRRLLGDCHVAEDVFQATFLVLARKAGSVRKTALLASWLYGVASRLALNARRKTRRRRRHEVSAADLPGDRGTLVAPSPCQTPQRDRASGRFIGVSRRIRAGIAAERGGGNLVPCGAGGIVRGRLSEVFGKGCRHQRSIQPAGGVRYSAGVAAGRTAGRAARWGVVAPWGYGARSGEERTKQVRAEGRINQSKGRRAVTHGRTAVSLGAGYGPFAGAGDGLNVHGFGVLARRFYCARGRVPSNSVGRSGGSAPPAPRRRVSPIGPVGTRC